MSIFDEKFEIFKIALKFFWKACVSFQRLFRRENKRRGPALRVSRAETRLTVYRPPYIGNPRGQRRSVIFDTFMLI